jgi:tetratricopeptide (TPR) repeat protein
MAPRLIQAMAVLAVIGCPTGEPQALEAGPAYEEIQRVFLREDFQAVATLAQTFLVEHPGIPEESRVRIWLALSLDRLERSTEALQTLDVLGSHLASDDPLWAEVLFWEGDVSRRAFQIMRAKLAFQRLLERYPDSSWTPMAQLGLGLIYTHQQAFELARQQFHKLAIQKTGTPLALEAIL